MKIGTSINRFVARHFRAMALLSAGTISNQLSSTSPRDEPAFAGMREIVFDYMAFVLTGGLIGTALIILCALALSGLLQFNSLLPKDNQRFR